MISAARSASTTARRSVRAWPAGSAGARRPAHLARASSAYTHRETPPQSSSCCRPSTRPCRADAPKRSFGSRSSSRSSPAAGSMPLPAGPGRCASRRVGCDEVPPRSIARSTSGSNSNAAVAYVPHAEAGTVAAVALAGVAAGYRLRRILYQRDALAGVGRDRSSAAALLEFDPAGALLKDQPVGDAKSIEEAMRAGVRAAVIARGEPIAGDRAAVAALEGLSESGLLPTIALTRSRGVSELELFLDHLRSALADASKSGLLRIQHAGQEA